LEPLTILLVDVTVQSHFGCAYMGLGPRTPPHAPVTEWFLPRPLLP